jgi:cytochrome c556
VDLSKWADSRLTATTLREATSAIMADVTALVAVLRGEEPPAVAYDPAAAAALAKSAKAGAAETSGSAETSEETSQA